MIGRERTSVGLRPRGVRTLGWVAVITGYCLALFVIRGIFLWVKLGLFAGRAFWLLVGQLLFLAFAAYLFAVGRRAISVAKGDTWRRMRFGWGRMLVGALLLFFAASNRFQLFPARVVHLEEYENGTQASSGSAIEIAVCVGSLFLIGLGIRKGFRNR